MLMSEPGASRNRRTRDSDTSYGSAGPSSIRSEAMSEYRAATVRSVRARYEQRGPSEHMRLTHELENWKKADDSLSVRGRGKRKESSGRSGSVTEDGARSHKVR